MASFYNAADKKLYEKYKYLPQEKYRLGLTLPTDATEDEVVTDQGIVNTNAFANTGGGGDGFGSTGNMFGEGTPVSPVYGNTYIDTVRREGPDSRQAVEALINAGGTYPAGLQSAEGGFEYTSDFGNNLDYSKGAFDSLESEDQKRGFLSKMFNKAGQIKSSLPAWAQAGITALNPFSIIPSLLSGIGGDGPKYGIAGLTDQQKGLYDSLASQGMLFDSSGIMKTMTGKNFMGKGYLEGQQDIYNEMIEEGYTVDSDGNVVKPDGTLASGYLKNKFLESNISGKGKTIKDTTLTPELINEFLENNNTPINIPPGYDGSQNQRPEDKQDPPSAPSYTGGGGSGVPDQIGGGDGPGDRPDNSGGGGHTNPGKGSYGPHFARGGRVKYFYGGKV